MVWLMDVAYDYLHANTCMHPSLVMRDLDNSYLPNGALGYDADIAHSQNPLSGEAESESDMNKEMQKKITFITSNSSKLAEIQRALSLVPSNFEFARGDADLPEFQGEPVFVAEQKCMFAAKENPSGPVLVEDTSLCYRALGELPGVYVKWFLEKTGRKGLVNMLAAYDDKVANAQCIFALTAGPGYPVHCFVGRTQGKIVDPRGPLESFGWDPVFEPDEGNGKTFAEMTKDEKNAISHRGKALRALCEFLKTWEPEKERPMLKRMKPSDDGN